MHAGLAVILNAKLIGHAICMFVYFTPYLMCMVKIVTKTHLDH